MEVNIYKVTIANNRTYTVVADSPCTAHTKVATYLDREKVFDKKDRELYSIVKLKNIKEENA